MKQNNKGYTLIEMLVVVVVFAIIGIIASETIILTLRGTQKADAISKVRNNLDFAVGQMERQIRGAKQITSSCTGSSASQITFLDQDNNSVTLSCVGTNTNNLPSYVASGSAAITPSTITISNCSFTCIPGSAIVPSQVTINITAQDASGTQAPVTDTTQITLRSH